MISTKKLLYKVVQKIGSVESDMSDMWETVYPVGSYYETSDASFDPNVTWGGTWSLETAGQVHIGAGTGYTIGTTGGAETVTLTTSQIPAHTHNSRSLTGSIWARKHSTGSQDVGPNGGIVTEGGNGASFNGATANASYTHNTNIININATHTHDSVGGNGAHNNMQPYIVVNRWHRTA